MDISDISIIDAALAQTTTTRCEYYNSTCNGSGQQGCMEIEECDVPAEGQQLHCYVLWSVLNGTAVVSLKVFNITFKLYFFVLKGIYQFIIFINTYIIQKIISLPVF